MCRACSRSRVGLLSSWQWPAKLADLISEAGYAPSSLHQSKEQGLGRAGRQTLWHRAQHPLLNCSAMRQDAGRGEGRSLECPPKKQDDNCHSSPQQLLVPASHQSLHHTFPCPTPRSLDTRHTGEQITPSVTTDQRLSQKLASHVPCPTKKQIWVASPSALSTVQLPPMQVCLRHGSPVGGGVKRQLNGCFISFHLAT
jgi:hypothetical protein